MRARSTFGSLALAMTLLMMTAIAAADEAKYPDWKGQWLRQRVPGIAGQPSFDPNRPWGKGQQAPLTAEYQAILEANLKSQSEGGLFDWRGAECLGFGMPLITYGFQPLEFIITPETTYVLVDWVEHTRRIYTDGRDWPKTEETWFTGYSIGKWRDTDGDGRFDTLEVETRHVRGPRVWDQSGMPMAADDDGVITERIYSDKSDPGILRVEMTTVDNSLTRPWTVVKTFKRREKVWWANDNCNEGQAHITIGTEVYFRSADGSTIMPMKKDQPPPDLKYFKRTPN